MGQRSCPVCEHQCFVALQVDVLQRDSFYDMIDSRDAEAVRVILREQDVSAGKKLPSVCCVDVQIRSDLV